MCGSRARCDTCCVLARRDTELAAGLGVAVALIGIELVSAQITQLISNSAMSPHQVGFLSGLSMFSPVQALLSIGQHLVKRPAGLTPA